MNVYLTFLGCRLNESELEELAWRFATNGHTVVYDPESADVGVVNTCTVTAEAGRKSRQIVRRLARANPDMQIAVTGCHATMAPSEVARLPNVGWVVKNVDKERLAELVIPSPEPARSSALSFEQEPHVRHLGPGRLGRTRAFVKVQDGCDNRCAFCITTVARGPATSRPMVEIVNEVRGLTERGFKEAVLTGVHLGSYGRDRGDVDGLRQLVLGLLVETEIPRLRLSSLEPWDLSADFFGMWDDRRLCRQLHLPLQSGCDATLRRMARHTSTRGFAELVVAARTRVPDLALTTDIMVGFPGESQDAFEDSYRFVEGMDFARLHVFPFSPRPGTAANRMPDQVADEVKTARGHAMRQLGERHARRFRNRFLGRTLPVLWEASRGNGTWRGFSDNYVSVTTTSTANLANCITQTRLVEDVGPALRGEVDFDVMI